MSLALTLLTEHLKTNVEQVTTEIKKSTNLNRQSVVQQIKPQMPQTLENLV